MSPGAAKSYKNLVVWQRGMQLAHEIYTITRCFPSSETYGLVAQLRRAAVSIPSNIAEGNGRQSAGDFIRFLLIARGSSQEVETQLLLASGLQYLTHAEAATALKS